MKIICFIINQSRKSSPAVLKTLALANASEQLNVRELRTNYAGHAIELARDCASTHDVIIAVGGDGTCNEVIQGIVESGNLSVGFGIIPNGTGNDFARMFPLFNPESFISALETNPGKWIDVGCAQMKQQKRYFANIADVGFGAKVVQIMNNQRKNKLKGKMSYSLAIIRAFFSYKKSQIKISGDGFEFDGKVLMVAFCNGSTFGHGLTINPDATLENGKICITVIGDISLMTYIRKLGDLKKGRKIIHPEAYYFESSSVRIDALHKHMVTEGDGELFGEGLQEVFVLPKRLRLISQS